jgi:hypothetical protein
MPKLTDGPSPIALISAADMKPGDLAIVVSTDLDNMSCEASCYPGDRIMKLDNEYIINLRTGGYDTYTDVQNFRVRMFAKGESVTLTQE